MPYDDLDIFHAFGTPRPQSLMPQPQAQPQLDTNTTFDESQLPTMPELRLHSPEEIHDGLIAKSADFLNAFASRLDPSAFRRRKDQQTASIIAAILGGVGAYGKSQHEDKARALELKNQQEVERYRAAAQPAIAARSQLAQSRVAEPFERAREGRAGQQAERMVDYQSNAALNLRRQTNQMDLDNEDVRLKRALANGTLTRVPGLGVMTPAELGRYNLDKITTGMAQAAHAYGIIDPDLLGQMNFERQLISGLQQTRGNLALQSRSEEATNQISELDRKIAERYAHLEQLRAGALAFGRSRLGSVPTGDRDAYSGMLDAYFGTRSQDQVDTERALSSPLNDASMWDSAGFNQRKAWIASALHDLQASSDPSTRAIIGQSIRMRMAGDPNLQSDPDLAALGQQLLGQKPSTRETVGNKQ